jgi:hypothetical protein
VREMCQLATRKETRSKKKKENGGERKKDEKNARLGPLTSLPTSVSFFSALFPSFPFS